MEHLMTYVHSSIVNGIGVEGTHALAESLNQNTTLTELNLTRMLEIYERLFIAAQRDIIHDICIFYCTLLR